MKWPLVFLLALLVVSPSWATSILPASPFTFTNGTIADATQVNANFNSIITNTNANAAEAGINNSITSLTGLTTPLPINEGGTGQITATLSFDALSPLTTQGDLLYNNGTHNVRLPAGTLGQFLTTGGPSGNPSWVNTPASSLDPSYFNIITYGAACNGVTDDTTADQAAITAAQAVHGIVWIPANCKTKISSTLLVTSLISIEGASRESSIIIPSTTSVSALSVSISGGVTHFDFTLGVRLSKFSIQYASQALGGTFALKITNPGANINWYSTVDNILIYNGQTCIQMTEAANWTITNSALENCASAITISDPNASSRDVGDNVFSNNVMHCTSHCIDWLSGGGQKFIGNKLSAGSIGLNIQMDAGALNSGLLFEGNSVEGQTSINVAIQRGAGAALENIQISGNEFAITSSSGNTAGVEVVHDATGAWMTNVIIQSNIFEAPVGGTYFGIILDDMNGFINANNLVKAHGATNTLSTINAAAINGILGPNRPVGTFSASVNSGTGNVIVQCSTAACPF